VLPGILLAVMLSVANVFRRVWRPGQAQLGRVPGLRGYHDLDSYPDALRLGGSTILRFDAPLIFANAGTFRESVMAAADDLPEGGWIIVAAEAITDVDTTACDMLDDLVAALDRRHRHFVMAELKKSVRAKLDAYGLNPDIPADRFYPTVHAAADACQADTGQDWQSSRS
jgi:MFS superfamily sulfate permease-like transporter